MKRLIPIVVAVGVTFWFYFLYSSTFGRRSFQCSPSISEKHFKVQNAKLIAQKEDTVFEKVRTLTQCNDKGLDFFVEQRGKFLILYNYVVASKRFKCFESVTYTTQGDATFLDNLIPLVERWNGPISVSVYAPGDDFKLAMDSIAFLRNCESPLIKKYVSFHLFFESAFIPKNLSRPLVDRKLDDHFNCSKDPPYAYVNRQNLFKTKNQLLYPINIARNSARRAAQTHFVFASDMELYPTRNFISKILEFFSKRDEVFFNGNKQVFVLPVFEVPENARIPENKTILQKMIKKKEAFIFHERLCRMCHVVPEYSKWLKTNETDELDVLTVAKRAYKFKLWEPFFVGTNLDPLFDERLTWEGQSNKMTQNYAQCLLDYDYMILNNAFLVHRPGIKKCKEQMRRYGNLVAKTNTLIRNSVAKELKLLYGTRAGCK